MNAADIDNFLHQLSPAQETVVLLREIRDLLKPLHDAEVRRESDHKLALLIAAENTKHADATYAAAKNKGKR